LGLECLVMLGCGILISARIRGCGRPIDRQAQVPDFVLVKTKRGPAVERGPDPVQSAHADW
jgi:hypothetical protein